MSASWINSGLGSNITARSNYPTQKSVGILGEAAGDYPAGTIITCFTDTLANSLPSRKFFVLTPGANAFNTITPFNPNSSQIDGKVVSCSFVIMGTKIYAITNVNVPSPGTGEIWLGIYDLSDGAAGEWDSVLVAAANAYMQFPDLDYSGNVLLMSWTDANTTPKIYTRWYRIAEGVLQVRFEANLTHAGVNAKVSVWAETNGNFYLHHGGYVNGQTTGDSSLHYGSGSSNLLQSAAIAQPNIPDAQMATGYSGDLGFLGVVGTDFVFNRYIPSSAAMGVQENIQEGVVPNNFNYGLTSRGTSYHVFGGVVMWHWIRPYNIPDWNYFFPSPNTEPGYPGGLQDYYGCHNTPLPDVVSPDYYGLCCVKVDGSSPYSLWYRHSGELTFPVPNYEEGFIVSARSLDVSTQTGAVARRGDVANTILQIQDSTKLSDDILIYASDDTVFQFAPNLYHYASAPGDMLWKSGYFADEDDAFKNCIGLRCVFTAAYPLVITIFNKEGTFSKAVSLAITDSGKYKFLRLMGRGFYWKINYSYTDNLDLSRIIFYTEQTQHVQ